MRSVIPDALELAERVAETILTRAYKLPGNDSEVTDVLLFGSALSRQQDVHDIDMLVIHRGLLGEFGYATRYEEGEFEPDRECRLSGPAYPASCILDAMGGSEFMSFDSERLRMYDTAMRQLQDGDSGGKCARSLWLPYFGKFAVDDTTKNTIDYIMAQAPFLLAPSTVSESVHRAFLGRELDTNTSLDLHAMHLGLLSGDEYAEERKIVIGQCVDPTFWATVLSTGRLYQEGKGFCTPVGEKYPCAIRLFEPRT